MRRVFLPLLFIAVATAGAQEGAPGRVPQWRCTLPGGSYSVAVRAMVSVSLHEYIVDGVARVTEANIDTLGNALVRFYHVEPITPQSPVTLGQSVVTKLQELTGEAADRTGQEEPWKKVAKTFPGSTHAHTIDFRVDSKETLRKLVESADNALKNGRDTTFKVP